MGLCIRRAATPTPGPPQPLPAHSAAEARGLAALGTDGGWEIVPAQPTAAHGAALAALRYRFGIRWHALHLLKVAADAGVWLGGPLQRWGHLALRKLQRQRHKADEKLLKYLKANSEQ